MRPSTATAFSAALLLALAAGCASSEPKASSLTPGDFVASPAQAAAAPAAPTPIAVAPVAKPPAARPITPQDARENIGPTEVHAQAPQLAPTAPAPLGEGIIVDAKIGDVNNRAVYASTFLAPKAARLRTDAAERLKASPRADPRQIREEWRQAAGVSIRQDLDLFVASEILRAEALSSFTPEQKVGLRSYLEGLQANLIRESGGSRARAEERVTTGGGVGSLDEYSKNQEQSELVKYEIDRSISRKVQVPWRDIKMAYESQADRYHPPAVARFRVILVSARNTAAVDAVTSALASGKAFEEVAAGKENLLGSKDAGLSTKQVKDEFAKGSYFGEAEVNTAVRALVPGGVAGPIKTRDDVWWVKLESIDKSSVSLYEAQQELELELRNGRKNRLLYRYLDRLKSRASFTNLDEMVGRLVDFATDRYFEPTLAEWRAGKLAPGPAGSPAPTPAEPVAR